MLVAGLLAVMLPGAGRAGAAPSPATPGTPSVTARSGAPLLPPLRVTLPGLLTVSVDLPTVKVGLGGQRTAAGTRESAPPAARPSQTATASPAPSSARPAPREVATPTRAVTPRRPATREPRRAAPADNQDVVAPARRPAASSSATPRPATARPIAEAFQGMLHTGLPVWLLVGVVTLCGLGTVLVVRSAGRRSLGEHRPTG